MLACREELAPPPLVLGGAQERGRRAGTESVFLAEGFAAAVGWIGSQGAALASRLQALRERLIERLRGVDGLFLNGEGAPRLPNTFNGGFEGVPAQSLLTALDLDGVAVSAGSACSSGAIEPSHVLRAMGLPRERVASSLRISLGHATTEADVERCAEAMCRHAGRIRAMNDNKRRFA
jgi:cysteine desulfurase